MVVGLVAPAGVATAAPLTTPTVASPQEQLQQQEPGGIAVLHGGQQRSFDTNQAGDTLRVLVGSDVVDDDPDAPDPFTFRISGFIAGLKPASGFEPGSRPELRAGPFDPGTELVATLQPGAVTVGEVEVDGNGGAELELHIPADLPACPHTLHVRATMDGEQVGLDLGLGAVASIDPFDDVRAGSVHGIAVACLAARDVIRGVSATAFAPREVITRGQASSLIARQAGLVDSSASHRAAMDALIDAGVVTGYADGTLGVHDPLTRGQAASVLARFHGLDPVPAPFEDAGGTHGGAIGALSRLGIEGYGDGRFGTHDPIRRAQFASMLYRVDERL